MSDSRGRLRQRLAALPVFPTLLTSGNLACGVTAVLCAAAEPQPQLWLGAILVIVAMIFDMFDGKVARMTGTDGLFGAELDSLADVVSFGLAPAMLVHRLVLGDQPESVWGDGERFIWFLAVWYVVMTAIRLARYNVEHAEGATSTFRGLPSPGSAAVICAWVLFYAYYAIEVNGVRRYDSSSINVMSFETFETTIRFILIGFTSLCSILMVSRVPFPHIGNTLLSGRAGMWRLVIIIAVLGLVVTHPIFGIVIVATLYLLGGLLLSLSPRGKTRPTRPRLELLPSKLLL